MEGWSLVPSGMESSDNDAHRNTRQGDCLPQVQTNTSVGLCPRVSNMRRYHTGGVNTQVGARGRRGRGEDAANDNGTPQPQSRNLSGKLSIPDTDPARVSVSVSTHVFNSLDFKNAMLGTRSAQVLVTDTVITSGLK